ncbi:MAG: hypothetical protein ACM65L_10745 [Microcoleus sp.]
MSDQIERLIVHYQKALLIKPDNTEVYTHIPHPQLAHRRVEGVKVNHPRQK